MFPSTKHRLNVDETNITELHQEFNALRSQNKKFRHAYFKLMHANKTIAKLQHYIFENSTKSLLEELSLRLESNDPYVYKKACTPYDTFYKRKVAKLLATSHFFKDLAVHNNYLLANQLTSKLCMNHLRRFTINRINKIYNLVPGYKKLKKPTKNH